MNKAQREIYIVLANEVDTLLCSFCKFWKCCGSICDEVDGECTHKLCWRIEDQWGNFGIIPGCDC
jgi:hypothetical protein